MIGTLPVGILKNAVISGCGNEGFFLETREGKPLQMALVAEDGSIIEMGDDVAIEAWNVAMKSFRNFWIAQGHLRVYHEPPVEPII